MQKRKIQYYDCKYRFLEYPFTVGQYPFIVGQYSLFSAPSFLLITKSDIGSHCLTEEDLWGRPTSRTHTTKYKYTDRLQIIVLQHSYHKREPHSSQAHQPHQPFSSLEDPIDGSHRLLRRLRCLQCILLSVSTRRVFWMAEKCCGASTKNAVCVCVYFFFVFCLSTQNARMRYKLPKLHCKHGGVNRYLDPSSKFCYVVWFWCGLSQ